MTPVYPNLYMICTCVYTTRALLHELGASFPHISESVSVEQLVDSPAPNSVLTPQAVGTADPWLPAWNSAPSTIPTLAAMPLEIGEADTASPPTLLAEPAEIGDSLCTEARSRGHSAAGIYLANPMPPQFASYDSSSAIGFTEIMKVFRILRASCRKSAHSWSL